MYNQSTATYRPRMLIDTVGETRITRVKNWITKLSKPPNTPDTLPDDITLCDTHGLSKSFGSSINLPNHSNNNEKNNMGPKNKATPVLDPSRIDTSIAMAIRAKQLDQEGNAQGAVCLFTACLEHLALSLTNTEHVRDQKIKERLNMLQLLLTDSIDATGYDKQTETVCCQNTSVMPHNDISNQTTHPSLYMTNNNGENLRTTLFSLLTGMLVLLNQAVIFWFLLLGNALMWGATKFKNSNLPELSAQYLTFTASWVYKQMVYWNATTHCARAGKMVWSWMLSVDAKTGFSQRFLHSSVMAFGAILSVIENSNKDKSE